MCVTSNPGEGHSSWHPYGWTDIPTGIADELATKIAEATAAAVQQALRNILYGLSLTDDERKAVETMRANQIDKAVHDNLIGRQAHDHIMTLLHGDATGRRPA